MMFNRSHAAPGVRVSPSETARWMTAGLTICFALLTAIAAQMSVWIGPVPITMQTAVVLLAGAMLGPVAGASSQMLYLAMGACGLPVFAGTAAGAATLVGPTGGYLLGFVPAALVVGLMAGPSRGGWKRLVAGVVAGTAVVLALGVAWLALLPGMTPVSAVQSGLVPFLPGAVAKGIIVVSAALLWRRSGAARLAGLAGDGRDEESK